MLVALIIYVLPNAIMEQLELIFNVELQGAGACVYRSPGQGDCVVFNDMIESTQKQLASTGSPQQQVVNAILEFVTPALSCENARFLI